MRTHGFRARNRRIFVEKEIVRAMWASYIHGRAQAGAKYVRGPGNKVLHVISVDAARRRVALEEMS